MVATETGLLRKFAQEICQQRKCNNIYWLLIIPRSFMLQNILETNFKQHGTHYICINTKLLNLGDKMDHGTLR
jgi:hypothetical protein